MKREFNLIDEPWIRVLTSGFETKEVSLRTFFEKANEYRAFAGETDRRQGIDDAGRLHGHFRDDRDRQAKHRPSVGSACRGAGDPGWDISVSLPESARSPVSVGEHNEAEYADAPADRCDDRRELDPAV